MSVRVKKHIGFGKWLAWTNLASFITDLFSIRQCNIKAFWHRLLQEANTQSPSSPNRNFLVILKKRYTTSIVRWCAQNLATARGCHTGIQSLISCQCFGAIDSSIWGILCCHSLKLSEAYSVFSNIRSQLAWWYENHSIKGPRVGDCSFSFFKVSVDLQAMLRKDRTK
jgi:hypothetical protein